MVFVESVYGYSRFTEKYKIICKIVTDEATTADTYHVDNAFEPANSRRDVCAKRGYMSKARARVNHVFTGIE
jgi:hypothetical protein